jgi:hypothetical protein
LGRGAGLWASRSSASDMRVTDLSPDSHPPLFETEENGANVELSWLHLAVIIVPILFCRFRQKNRIT